MALVHHHSFLYYFLSFIGIILGRYLAIAGGTHYLIHTLFKQVLIERGIKIQPPVWESIYSDLKLSVYSTAIFAVAAALIMMAFDRGGTCLYANWDEHELWYVGFSFGIVLALQDTYFYFIHRLFHHPLLFRLFHRGHHLSKQTTAWTSFAFDPAEALFQALFIVAIVFTIPLHFATAIAIIMTMTIWSVFNHLGFPLFPNSGYFHWCSQWAVGPLHHAVHHHQYSKRYGLYFTFWDKLLGTQDLNYNRVKILDESANPLS